MNLSDTTKWARFVHELLYPAILGSMLYDLFDWAVLDSITRACGLAIVALYSVDYIHLYLDLRSDKKVSDPIAVALNAGAALVMRWVFAAAIANASRVAAFLLFVIFLAFALCYYSRRPRVTRIFLVVYAVLLGINAIVAWRLSTYSPAHLLGAVVIVLALYIWYVFFIYQRYVRQFDEARA